MLIRRLDSWFYLFSFHIVPLDLSIFSKSVVVVKYAGWIRNNFCQLFSYDSSRIIIMKVREVHFTVFHLETKII